MKKLLRRSVLALAIAVATGSGLAMLPLSAQAQTPDAQQLASGNGLKTEAFQALLAGNFDKTSELLSQAASILKDPVDRQMAVWADQYESQREKFVAERHKQYDKAIADVKLLQAHHKDEYVLDATAQAFLLADDQKAFRNLPWVDDVIQKTIVLANKHEADEQWLKAMRLYADLGSVEPGNPLWKEKLKSATRRVRLLAMYAPDELRAVQDAESKGRAAVDLLLHPSTQPTTAPLAANTGAATHPTTAPAVNDSFRVDWQEQLKGVRMEMLSEALTDARIHYYREVPQRDVLMGGLNAIKAVITTNGLAKTFPGLADAPKKAEFTTKLDALISHVKDSTVNNEGDLKQYILSELRTDNADTINLPEPVVVNEFADGAFAQMDPFSNMIWPSEAEEFDKTTQGQFSGVGIQIESAPDGSLRVVSPLPDSPAAKAGIKPGDIIAAIDGKNAKGISLNQAVKSITGPIGTSVVLTIRSIDGRTRDCTIVRHTIKVESIKGWLRKPGGAWEYFIDPAQKIAYIRLTSFSKSTSEELDKAAAELSRDGMRAIILDLRYNPGGLLTAATEVSDKFLDHGVIVKTHADRETPNLPMEADAKADDDDIKAPMVVLVNQFSASASEIVSGALKDHKRALIVGERTFGKGSVQMLFQLDGGKARLKLTTAHYYLPNGRCIHREENSTDWGVDPDVKVEMTPEQMRVAIDARQDLDILRDANDATPPPPATNPTPEEADLIKARKDPLGSDSQLSAALLVLRLELSGAKLINDTGATAQDVSSH